MHAMQLQMAMLFSILLLVCFYLVEDLAKIQNLNMSALNLATSKDISSVESNQYTCALIMFFGVLVLLENVLKSFQLNVWLGVKHQVDLNLSKVVYDCVLRYAMHTCHVLLHHYSTQLRTEIFSLVSRIS